MNQLLKEAALLNKKAAFRKEKELFIAEGLNCCREVPDEAVRAVVYTAGFEKEHPDFIASRIHLKEAGIPFLKAADSDFERISDTKTPQGILMEVEFFHYAPEELLRTENGLFLFLETVQDPGNLGTMMRSAEAAGVTGVLIGTGSADIYNPKTVRATMGAVFRVPFAENVDIRAMSGLLQSYGGQVLAAALSGSVPYDTPDYRKSSAFVIGNEAAGLTAETIACSDMAVRIPMLGKTESLNAGVAASVLLFEAARQRRAACTSSQEGART